VGLWACCAIFEISLSRRSLVDITRTAVNQAAQGLRDRELIDAVARSDGETKAKLSWLRTRLTQAAPQALIVA
jgi:hypothetical protein